MLTNLDPSVEAVLRYGGFCLALWGALWGSKEKDSDDEDTVEANEGILDMISDGDSVRFIELVTGENIRDQLTVKQALDLHEEARLLKMKGKRN